LGSAIDGLSKLEKGDDCWITSSALKTADVLLRKPRSFRNLLLREAALSPYAGEVVSHQPAHVHGRKLADALALVYQL
jgi:hypothetical protein